MNRARHPPRHSQPLPVFQHEPPADMGGAASPAMDSRRWISALFALCAAAFSLCLLSLCLVAALTGGLAVIDPRRMVPTPTPTRAPFIAGAAGRAGLAGYAPPRAPTATATAAAPTATASAGRPGDVKLQLRVFRQLWSAVKTYYVYPDYNGVDWMAARAETEARINDGMTDEAFYQAMRDLIDSLGDDHSQFLSPQEVQLEEEEYAGAGNYVGIGVLTDFNREASRVYVLQVIPGSPAWHAGVRAHDHLLKADGMPLVAGDGEPRLAMLRGTEGSTVTVTVRTPGSLPRDLVIRRARLSSAVVVESRLLQEQPRIGYILIPTFFEESVVAQVRKALASLMAGPDGRLDGLVIDMRINGGGAYEILTGSLGFFTGGTVGYLVDRLGVQAPVFVERERIGNSLIVPIAVLTGPSTQSYAEVFAGVLRNKGRARLVGQRSGGNVETLHAHRFDDGSIAWIAQETFRLPGGANWEGRGLLPDAVVDKPWDEFSADDDPALRRAIALLNTTKRP